MTASTPSAFAAPGRSGPICSYGESQIVGNHAYSVIGFDEKTGSALVVNPWNNRVAIPIKESDFFELFESVVIAEKRG